MSRRQLLAGAGTAVGAGLLLGSTGFSLASAAGLRTPAHGGRLLASTPASAASGTVTFGSNYSDDVPKAAFQAMIDGLGNPDIDVKINTVDHNTFQENITTYLQQPDDLITWFAGYRLRYFADQGLLGDISDVWAGLDGFSEGFKAASTGDDGKQYFVPLYNYPWAVHYSKSLFDEKGYTRPDHVGRADRPRRPDEGRRDHPVLVRQRRQVAGDGHVRHPQHADQRLRLPHQPDGR